jgi:hypothetical protein
MENRPFDNNMFFTKNANNEVYLEKAGGDLSKSKLRTGYIIVPLGVQYNFSKLKMPEWMFSTEDFTKDSK